MMYQWYYIYEVLFPSPAYMLDAMQLAELLYSTKACTGKGQ